MKKLIVGISIGCILLLSACVEGDKDKKAVQAAIMDGVKNRIADYQSVRLKRCREQMLEEANLIVDSIMLIEARLAKDTLDKPLKPLKPEKPEIKTILDTLPVKPILTPQEIDSLRKRNKKNQDG